MKTRTPFESFRHDRRRVLMGGVAAMGGFALLGERASAARVLAGAAQDDDGPILVVVQLAGGNDGLNTVVPYPDDRYHNARAKLGVRAEDVLRIDDYRGFNPLLPGMRDLWDRGELAIVEGVGYEHPNRSHFASFDIWHAADTRGKSGGYGWLARLAAELRRGDARDVNLAVHVGDRMPYSLYSPEAAGVCFRNPAHYKWNQNETAICDTVAAEAGMESADQMARLRNTFLSARESSGAIRAAVDQYQPRVEYPDSQLGYSLGVCAALIQQGVGSRILSVELTGFDTHAGQGPRHQYLLREWNGALTAFMEDLRGTPAADRTAVLMFSEFGRRVAENASGGTDHGTAGPVFLAGPAVAGGLYGQFPSLEPDQLDEGDLIFNTDFRSVYATLVQDWMKRDAGALLGASYPTLPLFA
jgi:uncharacterized protein (DUF1501 family)